MEGKKISRPLLKRLPMYLDYIRALPVSVENISATRIAKALEMGDVLVRKDLAQVSCGGRRKLGYNRENLIRDIEEFLDINSTTNAVVVGAGKLGQTLLDYEGFSQSGLKILAGFDIDPAAVLTAAGKPIYHMDQLEAFCAACNVAIGIVTVPAAHAQSVCDRLVACGIRGIWNFCNVHLNVPGHIPVQTENLAVSLTALKTQLKKTDGSR